MSVVESLNESPDRPILVEVDGSMHNLTDSVNGIVRWALPLVPTYQNVCVDTIDETELLLLAITRRDVFHDQAPVYSNGERIPRGPRRKAHILAVRRLRAADDALEEFEIRLALPLLSLFDLDSHPDSATLKAHARQLRSHARIVDAVGWRRLFVAHNRWMLVAAGKFAEATAYLSDTARDTPIFAPPPPATEYPPAAELKLTQQACGIVDPPSYEEVLALGDPGIAFLDDAPGMRIPGDDLGQAADPVQGRPAEAVVQAEAAEVHVGGDAEEFAEEFGGGGDDDGDDTGTGDIVQASDDAMVVADVPPRPQITRRTTARSPSSSTGQVADVARGIEAL